MNKNNILKLGCVLLVGLIGIGDGFVMNHHNALRKYTLMGCIMKNQYSRDNEYKIIDNQAHNIVKIYTTYNNKYSLVFFSDGRVEECFNKKLHVKYAQEVLHMNIVSYAYFRKLYMEYVSSNKLE